MLTYRATLDVPAETARQVARWLSAHRKAHDLRPWQGAATPFVQAVMVLRWFREVTDLRVSRPGRQVNSRPVPVPAAAIDVIAAHTPDLHDVLAEGLRED